MCSVLMSMVSLRFHLSWGLCTHIQLISHSIFNPYPLIITIKPLIKLVMIILAIIDGIHNAEYFTPATVRLTP